MLSNTNKIKLIEKFKLDRSSNSRSGEKVVQTLPEEEYDTDTDMDLDVDLTPIEYNNTEDNNAEDNNAEDNNAEDNNAKEYTHYADTLPKDIQNKKYSSIKACIYKINDEELYPFTMFLLYKYDNNNLNFIKVNSNNKSININEMLSMFNTLFADHNALVEYKGFITNARDESIMLLFKYTTSASAKSPGKKSSIEYGTYDSSWWWVLASEIINYKYVLNFNINKDATEFLLENNKLALLYDKKGAVYETPEVGYYGNYYKKIAAVASLGLSRQGIYSSFGPFYYFSDYTHAMRNAFWTQSFKPKQIGEKYITVDDEGRYEKGGIVRFALFTGRTKMLIGRESDKPDTSTISQDLALTNEFIRAMLKLRDNSATWSKEYNSIRIGSHDIKLQDKPVIHTNPLVALKEYEQQVPIEYYFVDTLQLVEGKPVSVESVNKANITNPTF
jgi:hypothetical protein